MLSHLLFAISVIAALAILLLSIVSIFVKQFQFWPPPLKKSWQHKLFLILFRAFVYPLMVLTIVEFKFQDGVIALAQYVAGFFLFITGFGLAFRITYQMGWRNAFGEKRGLNTADWFSYSRNPVYVVTWVGLIGWGMIANSLPVSTLLALWAILYYFAPRLEEPWLEREYGEAYMIYKNTVPRFV